jgi:hypothetical protein
MKLFLRAFLLFVILMSLITAGLYFKNGDKSLAMKVVYDTNGHQIYLLITNKSPNEVTFNIYDSVRYNFNWELCSQDVVIASSSQEATVASLIPADHFPIVIKAYDTHRIDLAQYFAGLTTILSKSNADHLLWSWSFWDKRSLKWVQECGQLELR